MAVAYVNQGTVKASRKREERGSAQNSEQISRDEAQWRAGGRYDDGMEAPDRDCGSNDSLGDRWSLRDP